MQGQLNIPDAQGAIPWNGPQNGTGASPSYDEGGVVDPTNEDDGAQGQGAPSATVDPMQMVKQALTFGRQQMGVPTNFTDGPDAEQQSFDDGGEVQEQGVLPDPQAQPQAPVTGGGNMPDPKRVMSYLAGDGAVSPEVAQALEQHVDPQGSMDPAQRTMAALTAAPTPEAKFGMIQHYRTKYNAYSAAARAAMDQGNLGQAAINATQAFANVPGANVKFAPARGGLAVVQGGQKPQQQSFDDGGEVEAQDQQDDIAADQADDGVIPEAPAKKGLLQSVMSGDILRRPAPVVLSPEDAKAALQEGFDKPLDKPQESFLGSLRQSWDKLAASASAPDDIRENFNKTLSAPPTGEGSGAGVLDTLFGRSPTKDSIVDGLNSIPGKVAGWANGTGAAADTSPQDQADDDAADAADGQPAPQAPQQAAQPQARPQTQQPQRQYNVAGVIPTRPGALPQVKYNPAADQGQPAANGVLKPGTVTPAMRQTQQERAGRFLAQARKAWDPKTAGSPFSEAHDNDDLVLPTSAERTAAHNQARAEREGRWPTDNTPKDPRSKYMAERQRTADEQFPAASQGGARSKFVAGASTAYDLAQSKEAEAEAKGASRVEERTARENGINARDQAKRDAKADIALEESNRKTMAAQRAQLLGETRSIRAAKPNMTDDEFNKHMASYARDYGINLQALRDEGGATPDFKPIAKGKDGQVWKWDPEATDRQGKKGAYVPNRQQQ